MSVIEKAKMGWHRWRLFKEIEPGHRFQTRYNNHRQRRERGETSRYGRIFNLAGGSALIVAGFAFLPTPGPSYIIIVIGLWMLAGEFLPLARFFDRLEVRLRRLGRWIKGRWSRLPIVVKALVTLVCVAALGYGAYHLLLAVW
jgi:Putative transmembrane protein (PGPGW)